MIVKDNNIMIKSPEDKLDKILDIFENMSLKHNLPRSKKMYESNDDDNNNNNNNNNS